MPYNLSDPITDQEIAFALLVLSGTMTDGRAAEAVGLHPDSAADTKARPRVRAYMHEICRSSSRLPTFPAKPWAVPWTNSTGSIRTATRSWTASGNSPTSAPK